MVNQVLVLVVAYNYVSVFTSLALLSKVVQTLIAEAKSLELTPERIDKAFAEVGPVSNHPDDTDISGLSRQLWLVNRHVQPEITDILFLD